MKIRIAMACTRDLRRSNIGNVYSAGETAGPCKNSKNTGELWSKNASESAMAHQGEPESCATGSFGVSFHCASVETARSQRMSHTCKE